MHKKLSKVGIIFFILLLFFIQPIYASDSKLMITNDKAVNDKWFKVRSEDVPKLVSTTQVLQNQELMLLVFFMEPGRDASSNAKIYYDLKISHLGGSTLVDQKHIKVIDANISSAKIVRLSQEIPTMSLNEPAGKYLVQVTVKDEVSNTVQTHQQEIDLKEYSSKNYFTDTNTYNSWGESYYKKLMPEKAIAGLLFFSNLDIEVRNQGYSFACGFYSKILNDNPYLIPHLLKLYPEQSDAAKAAILSMLPYLKYDYSEFIKQLNENDKSFYTVWQKKCYPYPADGIQVKPTKMADCIRISNQMDMLWGTFFASGEYKPMKALVDLLELGQYKGNFDKYKESKDPAYEEKAALDVVYQTAKWSIASNCSQHTLVKNYCNFIYENENLSPQAKQELKEILGRE
jgi:hypothetical protein